MFHKTDILDFKIPPFSVPSAASGGNQNQYDSEIQSQRPEAIAAILELEAALAKISGQGVDASLLAAALAAVKSMQSRLGTPSFGAKLTEVKNLIGRIQNTQTERDGNVLSAQLEIQEARIALEYEHASSVKGFKFIDKRTFEAVSRLFDGMSLLERAYITKRAEQEPQLRSAIVLAELGGEKVILVIHQDLKQNRDLMKEIAETGDKQDPFIQRIAEIREISKFTRILPGNQTLFNELLQQVQAGKAVDEKTGRSLEEAKTDLSRMMEKGVSDGLVSMQRAADAAIKNHPAFKDYNGKIPPHLSHYFTDCNEAQAILDLVEKDRQKANDFLRPLAQERNISFAGLTDLYLKGELNLSEEQKKAMEVRILARSVQTEQRVVFLSNVFREDEKIYQLLVENINDQDRFVETMMTANRATSVEEREAFKELFEKSTVEERKAYLDHMKEGRLKEAQEVLGNILDRCSAKTKETIGSVDEVEGEIKASNNTPKMCTMPPSVQDQVNAAGPLNLGQKEPPKDFSPAYAPAPLAFSALPPQRDLSILSSPS